MMELFELVCCFFVTQIIGYHTTNVSLKPYPIQLPIPLFNHISATYENALHIVGGYTINTNNYTNRIPSNMTYSVNNFVNYSENINFNSNDIHSIFPLSCNTQCHVTIDDKLYILQILQTDLHLIIYDMANQYYESSYPIYHYDSMLRSRMTESNYIVACVFSYGNRIVILGGGNPYSLDGIYYYNTEDRSWSTG
eukprot:244416_1